MARKEDTFLLVSLKEDEAKKLAQVISNSTCRKILAYLSKNTATESEISKSLRMPISTVHYNLRQLETTGLVEAKEFHYSEKGKEVNHYSLAKKYVIIAPRTSENMKNKLKRILPVALIAVGASGLIHLFAKGVAFGRVGVFKGAELAAEGVIAEAADIVPTAAETAGKAGLPIALWFFFGAVFAIGLYFIIDLIRKK
jgi:DNA-binding transcriptional ArsR family regulator